MQLLGRQDVLRDSLDQRRYQRRRLADPISQRCAIKLDPLAGFEANSEHMPYALYRHTNEDD